MTEKNKKLIPNFNYLTPELAEESIRLFENPTVTGFLEHRNKSTEYAKKIIAEYSKLKKPKKIDEYRKKKAELHLILNNDNEEEIYTKKFLSDEKFKNEEIAKLFDNFSHFDKNELIQKLAERTILLKIYGYKIKNQSQNFIKLYLENLTFSDREIKNNTKRQDQRITKYESNTKALMECFEEFKKKKKGILNSESFNEW